MNFCGCLLKLMRWFPTLQNGRMGMLMRTSKGIEMAAALLQEGKADGILGTFG